MIMAEKSPAENAPLVTSQQLGALRTALGGGDAPVLLVVHDYPDPDAIASALAFQTLARSWGVDSTIAHGGGSGRPENNAMIELLKIETALFSAIENLAEYRGAFFLDTQPTSQNQSLPKSVPVIAVVDHHRLGDDSVRLAAPGGPTDHYADIRLDVGSTSTLALGYLAAAGMTPDARLASALFLGIKTDTASLLRDATKPDIAAYTKLLPLADLALVANIAKPSYTREHFRFIHNAMENAKVYDNILVADCGDIAVPDMISYVSDEFIKGKDIFYALALGGYKNRIYLSLRAKPPREDATRLLLAAIGTAGRGGGHSLTAGGFMEIAANREKTVNTMLQRFLQAAHCPTTTPQPLI